MGQYYDVLNLDKKEILDLNRELDFKMRGYKVVAKNH